MYTHTSDIYSVPMHFTGCFLKEPEAPSATPERQPGTTVMAPGGVAKLFIAWCGDCIYSYLMLRPQIPGYSVGEGEPETNKYQTKYQIRTDCLLLARRCVFGGSSGSKPRWQGCT